VAGFIAALAGFSLAAWIAVALRPSRPYLPFWEKRAPAALPADPPLVSIVIPARNEAVTVGRVVESHLRSDYPKKEIIVVDDGSTDGTAEAARSCASRFSSPLNVLQVKQTPEGWSGKVYAMHRGVEAASGRYILFTDADIVWDPDLLSLLVAESISENLGLNSRMVLLSVEGFWERVLVPAFVFFFSLLYPFRAVSRRGSKYAAAAGGCMLVNCKALEAAGGLESIKDAIIDDISLARRIKQAGFPLRLCLSSRARSLRRYPKLRDFWHTVTRTAFTELRYSVLRLAGATVALLLAFGAPLFCLVAGYCFGSLLGAVLGASALLLSCLLYFPTVSAFGLSPFYAAGFPLAGLLYLGMTWHSALRYATGRRSVWKGRVYRR